MVVCASNSSFLGRNSNRVQPVVQSTVSTEHERRQIGVLQLIAAYRNRGHQKSQT